MSVRIFLKAHFLFFKNLLAMKRKANNTDLHDTRQKLHNIFSFFVGKCILFMNQRFKWSSFLRPNEKGQ